jgi:HAD superfamily hydrolase (TIGR01484 family)
MRALSDYRHFFFDLDNTLTRSKSPIEAEHRNILAALPQDVVVISGAHHIQINKQLDSLPIIRMGQNGNHTFNRGNVELWRDVLGSDEEQAIRDHIAAIRPLIDHDIHDETDLLDHRGCQISFSILGHNRQVHDKECCDPRQEIRTRLLATCPLVSDTVEVRIAGTTCLDYFARGKHKGFNVWRLIQHYGWNPDECIYFGDALFPGGNDETVIGVIDTMPVTDYKHTYRIIDLS